MDKTNSFALLIYLEKMENKPECPVIKFPVVHIEIRRNFLVQELSICGMIFHKKSKVLET